MYTCNDFCSRVFFCRREARWYHGAAVDCGWIYRLKECVYLCVCVCLCAYWGGWSFLTICLSLPPAALPKCTVSAGLIWRGPANTTHSLLQDVPLCDILISSVSFGSLNGLRRSRQLGHFHVDHDAGGAEYNGWRHASSVSHVSQWQSLGVLKSAGPCDLKKKKVIF